MASPFYEKSNIVNFESNILYDELIQKTEEEVDAWIDRLREEVMTEWDSETNPTPPTIGKNEDELVKAWAQLRSYDIKNFYDPDVHDEKSAGIVANFSKHSGAANQFFPTMLKTRISESFNPDTGKSIYDWFSLPEMREKFKRQMLRTLVQDSMCSYTKSLHTTKNPDIDWTGTEAYYFFAYWKNNLQSDFGVFIRPYEDKNLDKLVNKYKKQGYIVILPEDVKNLYSQGLIDDLMLKYCGGIEGIVEYTHSDRKPIKRRRKDTDEEWEERQRQDEIDRRIYYMYLVRYYPRKFKIFPKALQTFRLGLGQPAVNFPAMTARWLFEHYTKHINGKVTVYDPSAGWGGRILGAMAAARPLHYVGTDPNTDNHGVTADIDGEEKIQSRYEWIAEFFNKKCLPLTEHPEFIKMYKRDFKKLENTYIEEKRKDIQKPNTYHVFDVGSEHVGSHPDFQQYRGQLDFVFTSPPYFNREQYSQDDTQSFKAYREYPSWRDGFLIPTLQTAWDFLAHNRYLCLNIADIKVGKRKDFPGGIIPLETDSLHFLSSMGAEYVGKLKMLMTSMIGVDQENLENSVEYDGKIMKYEPIMVFYKS